MLACLEDKITALSKINDDDVLTTKLISTITAAVLRAPHGIATVRRFEGIDANQNLGLVVIINM